MRHHARVEVPRIKAGVSGSFGILIEVEAPVLPVINVSRKSQSVVFVIDRSGSMGDGRLDLVKNTIGEMLGRLAPTDFLSIVSFDNVAETHVSLTQVKDLDPQAIRRELQTLQPRGGTDIGLGFKAGLDQASKSPEGVESKLILLSDGGANQGVTDPAAFGQLAAMATEHLVQSSTIGIGTNYNEHILVAMSESGHGNHFAAVELDEAVTGLQDELDGLVERSLQNVTVRIITAKALNGLTLKPIGFNRETVALPTGTSVRFGDQVSNETRGYAFMASLPALRRDLGEQLIFDVEVSAVDIQSGQTLVQSSQIVLEVAEPQGFVTPATDEEVSAEIMVYRLTQIKDEAARAGNRGDFSSAKQIILAALAEVDELAARSHSLSPRLRQRVMQERQELDELSKRDDVEFSKRAYESSIRTARAKSDPRKKEQ